MEEYVEKEYNVIQQNILEPFKPFPEETEFDKSYNEDFGKFHNELQDLYVWWKNLNDDDFDPAFEEKSDEMFDRLMKIRKFLWT